MEQETLISIYTTGEVIITCNERRFKVKCDFTWHDCPNMLILDNYLTWFVHLHTYKLSS